MNTPKFVQLVTSATSSVVALYGLTSSGEVYRWDASNRTWVKLENQEGYR